MLACWTRVCRQGRNFSSSVRYVSFLFLSSFWFSYKKKNPLFFFLSCFFFSISFFFSFRRVVYGRTASNCCAPPRLANSLKLKKKKKVFLFKSNRARISFFFLLLLSSFFPFFSVEFCFQAWRGFLYVCVCMAWYVYTIRCCSGTHPSSTCGGKRPATMVFLISAAGFSISKMDSFASWAVVPPSLNQKKKIYHMCIRRLLLKIYSVYYTV